MEEKYTQIKLNVGSIKDTSVESKPNEEAVKTNLKETKFDDPETIPMDIAENRQEIPLPDDMPLVSPDSDVFIKMAKDVNEEATPSQENNGERYATDWHTNNAVDSGDDFVANDKYANTSNSNRDFIEAFGLNGTGAQKAMGDKDNSSSADELSTDESEPIEYTNRLQNSVIKNIYDYAFDKLEKKLIFSAIFTILLFFVENIRLFFKEPTGIFNVSEFPYVHIGISALLLILTATCAYEQIYHGFKSIADRDYLPESVGVISLAVSVIHTVVSLITVPFGNTEPRMFNFVTAAFLLGTILFSFINVIREEYGFRAISGKSVKFYLEKVNQNNAEAEYDTFTTTSSGEINGQIARVGRTDFVKNYFHNTNANVDISKFMSIYYLIVLVVSVAFTIILAVVNKNALMITTYWGVSVMLMLPVGVLCAYSVPFFIGNKRLFEGGAAIIGEEAIEEFADANIVVVNDTTAFPPKNIKIQHFNVYNGYTIEKVSYYAANGFSIVGGPLAEVFDSMANNPESSRSVRFSCTNRSCLAVKVDGDKVIFADKFGMTSQGIEVGNEREGKDGSNAMYIAINGVLAAKLYIKYEIDDEFIRIVRLLNKNGIGVGIRTFDPNLNGDVLKKITSFKKKELRVIKLSSISEVTKTTTVSNARIASKGLSMNLIKAVPVCKKILFTRKVIKAMKIAATVGGAVLMALWAFGKLSFAFSAHIVGYHLIFVILMVVASMISMPKLR